MKRRHLLIGSVTLTLLFIPFVAMQFTDEVNWKITDFLIAGALIFTTGFLLNLAANKLAKNQYRFIVYATILIVFVLVWVELAVGIFGTPFAGD